MDYFRDTTQYQLRENSYSQLKLPSTTTEDASYLNLETKQAFVNASGISTCSFASSSRVSSNIQVKPVKNIDNKLGNLT